ncbi:MAG: hypothetical protein GY814_07185, partial [Gammaproteobacteria bacterium]|nr:hypothetical protein [Gammaproteobacteria bacterium]
FNFAVSSATLTNSPQTSYSGISQAYQFNGSGGGIMESLQDISGDPTDSDASFELWFRPESLSGEQILFETGATTDGMVLYLSGNNLVFATRDNGVSPDQISVDLTGIQADPTAEFIQAVAVIDKAGSQIELFINGVSKGFAGLTGVDWAGGDNTGLGQVNGNVAAGNGQFNGDIAIVRFYEKALTESEVQDNFSAISSGGGVGVYFTITGITDTTVAENAAFSGATPTLDGDTPVGNVTYSLSGSDAGLFSVIPGTGVVSMAAQDYESPADLDGNNVYEVTLIATDEDNNSASQAFSVTVTDVTESITPTQLGGDISGTLTAGEYPVVSDLIVPLGQTLTIPAGATLSFAADTQLQVYGELIIQGDVDNRVLLTSAASNPSMGDWQGIVVEDGATVSLDYVIVEYAESAIELDNVTGATGTVSNSELRSSNRGVYIYRGDSEVTIT